MDKRVNMNSSNLAWRLKMITIREIVSSLNLNRTLKKNYFKMPEFAQAVII